jgi:hypothetical protein
MKEDLNSARGLNSEEQNIIQTNLILRENLNNNMITNIKYDKIIIPYNFQKNSYSIPENEIEGYENKEFLLNTLHKYNNQTIFKFDSPYDPSICEIILFYLPVILIFSIIIYIILLSLFRFIFNPLVIYVSFVILKSLIYAFDNIKRGLYEKLKKKAIKKKLEETNKSKYCLDHNMKWKLGLSGYWLEIENSSDYSELQEY